MIASSSFRKKKLHMEAELPVGATMLRRHHVVEGLQLNIDRQLVDLYNFANSAANRQSPTLVAGGLPVRRNDRRRGDIPAMAEVVVNEWLDKKRVHALVAPPRKRPLVLRQRPDHPVPRRGQYHDGGSRAPLAIA